MYQEYNTKITIMFQRSSLDSTEDRISWLWQSLSTLRISYLAA